MQDSSKAHLAILTANLIYGANYTIAKFAMPEYINPSAFILLRVLFASAMFFLVSLFLRDAKTIERKDIFKLIQLGFFGVALNQLLFFEGLSRTSNINAALIMTTTPILVTVMAFFILKDKLALSQITGILLGMAGAVMLILQFRHSSGQADSLGDLMIFINAASYALFLVRAKPMMNKYGTVTVMKWTFIFGTAFVLPFGIPTMKDVEWDLFPAEAWFSVFFVLLFTTFFAYFLNTYGLNHLSPSAVSNYIYLQPLFATIIALWLAGEIISLMQVIACIFIFTGVYLVNSKAFVKIKS
ncbi:MAG: DMT family transporter [Bacteroidetes bacterium]|nr:MAG: DMT family transporter [Bacteroidota bacterium]REK00658.1 MAG: DMT family transporter [Bacteroidota bacterium]REK35220.1 MAG: DMT family transporter [Bacteroidota bacterium]REK48297.1 MAG: DMT family transporter [Bacteroidota bacterium]